MNFQNNEFTEKKNCTNYEPSIIGAWHSRPRLELMNNGFIIVLY